MIIKYLNIDIKKVMVYMVLNLKGNDRVGVINFGIIVYKCYLN